MRGLLFVAVLLVLAAAGVWALSGPEGGAPLPTESGAPSAAAEPEAGSSRRAERRTPRSRRRAPLRASRCPDDLYGCRSTRGRILYVETRDPDGDGDLHVVLAGGGFTGPGVTAVDVKPSLRPRRNPRVGDEASAAGPIQRGSFGQSQIHAIEFHVRRRPR